MSNLKTLLAHPFSLGLVGFVAGAAMLIVQNVPFS